MSGAPHAVETFGRTMLLHNYQLKFTCLFSDWLGFAWNEGSILTLMRNIYLNHSSTHGVSAVRVEVDQHVQPADSLLCSSQCCQIFSIARSSKISKSVPECAVWFLSICNSLRASSSTQLWLQKEYLSFCLPSMEFESLLKEWKYILTSDFNKSYSLLSLERGLLI